MLTMIVSFGKLVEDGEEQPAVRLNVTDSEKGDSEHCAIVKEASYVENKAIRYFIRKELDKMVDHVLTEKEPDDDAYTLKEIFDR